MHNCGNAAVEIVEVGPRDGYQGIGPFIPTDMKIRFLQRLVAAGLRRIEIGSFVSGSAAPQLRDTAEVLAACRDLPAFEPQVLVPSERRGRAAVDAGARRLVFVLSVSEAHNRNNVRRHPLESAPRVCRGIPAVACSRSDRDRHSAGHRDRIRLSVRGART
jgi:hydroxymethylglutaryl-CoA lyase